MATDRPRNYLTTPPRRDIKKPEDVARLLAAGTRFRNAEKDDNGDWWEVTYANGHEARRKPYRLYTRTTVTAQTTVRPRGTDYLKRRAEIDEESRRQRRAI